MRILTSIFRSISRGGGRLEMDCLLQKMLLALVSGTDLPCTACTSGALCCVSHWLPKWLKLHKCRCVSVPGRTRA